MAMATSEVDVRELFNLLESNKLETVEDITVLVKEQLSAIKEAWLLNSLVDYYYIAQTERAMDILSEVREPHDKHLIEKLSDGIRSEKNQLLAMRLLLHVVCKQPIWIYKIVKPPVFTTLIRCLKIETDVPLLMTGVMVLTILMPAVPAAIGKHISELFEVFSRLVNFNIKKPGNVPDVFLLHLQVALYGLFHRLYGMFPYNFLTFLRHHYSKKENTASYEEIIKPMLERIRLHPHLIIGTRELEIDPKRWRQMEAHDVVVECAKMSLDIIEGSWEEVTCPVISSRRETLKFLLSKRKSSQTSTNSEKMPNSSHSILSPPELSPTSGCPDFSLLWSPSFTVGLSTPPPSQRTTPATSYLENSTASFHQNTSGTCGNTPQMTPTTETPRATPPITEEQDKLKSKGCNKHRAGEIKKLNMSSKPFDVKGSSSVPPSPLRAEFTTEPPRDVLKSLPVKTAIRELSFDVTSKKMPQTFEQHSTESVDLSASESVVKEQDSIDRPDLMESYSLEGVVKVEQMEEADGDDQEVSEITKNHRDLSDIHLTAESVAKFMKSVNRIRFNSMTNEVESILAKDKFGSKNRSRSCPHLQKMMVTEEEGEDLLSRSVSTTFKESLSQASLGLPNENSVHVEPKLKGACDRTSTPNNIFQPSTSLKGVNVTINNSLTTQVVNNISIAGCPAYNRTLSSVSGQTEQNSSDFISVLQSLMAPARVSVCQRCKSQTLSAGTENGKDLPVFDSFSPPELLNQHLQMGGDMHAKQLSKIPITSQESINWTHFGGIPPADEINILRGQIIMMKNQILYERNKRELHAKRNRRLLRKITTANALEEETKAQAEQLKLQETEIQNLQVSLKLLQENNRRITETKESNEYENLVKLRSCLNEVDDLKSTKTELNTLLIRQREEQDELKAKLMKTEAQLFEEKKINEQLKQEVQMTQRLKEQVLQLHKELLLMGELQGKYETKLNIIRNSHHTKPEQEHMVATLKAENKRLKEMSEKTTRHLDSLKKRNAELEENFHNKKMALEEMQNQLEFAKLNHTEEIQAVEDKYKSISAINQQLESQVLKLYSQLDQLDRPKQAKPSASHVDKISEPSARERTGSFPSADASVRKRSLTQMNSAPLLRDLTTSEQSSTNVATDSKTHETGDVVQFHQPPAKDDATSLSSQESGMSGLATRTTLSYSEGEDRSHSSKGSAYDSGIMGYK